MKKEKEKSLPLKKTLSNNIFALKTVWSVSPVYLTVYLAGGLVYGVISFLYESYMLRMIVNGATNGESIKSIVIKVALIGIGAITWYGIMQWFWNVISPKYTRKIAASVEKDLFSKAREVELACYETPEFYDKYVKAMDGAYSRVTNVLQSLSNLIERVVVLLSTSFLLFLIDPVLILFGLFPLALGFLKRKSNILSYKMETDSKPVFRREDYVRRTFYLGEYAKEMRLGGIHKNMLRDLEKTYLDFKSLVKKYRLSAPYTSISKLSVLR